MATKQFHLGDVLSVTTGVLCSPERMGGVYAILNFMTNDDLYTHQLPRAADECKPYLLKQFPQLAAVDASNVNEKNVWSWLGEQIARFGERFDVSPIPLNDHDVIDPFTEFRRMTGREATPFNPAIDSIDDLKRRLNAPPDTDGERA